MYIASTSRRVLIFNNKNICFILLLTSLHEVPLNSEKRHRHLPFCQKGFKLLSVRNVVKDGIGFQHQLDDFIKVSRLAVSLNRTLVDFMPVFNLKHSTLSAGNEITYENEAVLTWSWRHFLDLDRFVFRIKNKRERRKCKLRVRSNLPTEEEIQMFKYDIASIDYAREKTDGRQMRIKDFQWEKSIIQKGLKNQKVNSELKGKPLSTFFKESALSAQTACLKNYRKKSGGPDSGAKNSTPKFFVVHIRGSDRPCVKTWMPPTAVLEKVETILNRHEFDVVYLMTDLKGDEKLIQSFRSHFGEALCESEDIKLFGLEPFKSNGYFRYVTELALQQLSDGFVSTYRSHQLTGEKNELGYIVNITDRYVKTC